MTNDITIILLFAVFGGLLPPLIWLVFWLREDEEHPEPKPLIVATFVAGMVTVPIALFLERYFTDLIGVEPSFNLPIADMLIVLLGIVFIEEIVKFMAARGIAFSNSNFDEPVDAIIYLISAALGFAALENALFLADIITGTNILDGSLYFNTQAVGPAVVNNAMRFMGANVLHLVASGMLGVFIGLSFYKNNYMKILYFVTGLIVAGLLHALFNFSIINVKYSPLLVFINLWVFTVLLIYLFEVVKKTTIIRTEN